MQQEHDRDNAECDIVAKDKGDDSKTNQTSISMAIDDNAIRN